MVVVVHHDTWLFHSSFALQKVLPSRSKDHSNLRQSKALDMRNEEKSEKKKTSRIWQSWELLAGPFAYSVEMSAVQTQPTQGSWLHCFSSQVRSHLVNSFSSNIAGETRKARPDDRKCEQAARHTAGRCLVKFLGASVQLADWTRSHWEGNCVYWCQGRLGLILSNQWATCNPGTELGGLGFRNSANTLFCKECVADFA